MPMRRWSINYKKIALALLIISILALFLFWLYVEINTYPALREPLETIKTHEGLTITEEGRYFILSPTSYDPSRRPVLYYPGGLVAPESYLHKMGHTAIALEKTVYIIKAPFNVAIFSIHAAKRIIDTYSLGQVWVGGHSLGGISASRFTKKSPEMVYGLFLLGSYSDQDLGDFEGRVHSVMGLEDKIIDWENYKQAEANLPPRALLQEIEGLNHSDFGDYGLQKGDGLSSVKSEEVVEIISNIFK